MFNRVMYFKAPIPVMIFLGQSYLVSTPVILQYVEPAASEIRYHLPNYRPLPTEIGGRADSGPISGSEPDRSFPRVDDMI